MASKIRNTIENRFTETGAKKVEKATAGVTKAQTRLGQSAASAGRQFSAQATGLGGLVSAYAGAAATVFALQQAFAALNAAARAEQTIAGVNALAAAIGESGPKVLASLQEITNGQLSLVQSAELANIALSSGFSLAQIEGLTEVGKKAAKALGRDLTDSVQRLLRGVAKLEPELLDELGIFTRIEPAAEAFAASIGKVASSLTAFEKRQAFANAAIKEGQDKFGDVDGAATTAAASLERLVATLSDIATVAGQLIANFIQPLVDALGAPVTAIATFGILAKTVFGTAIRELSKGAEDFTNKARFLGDTVTENIEKRFGLAARQTAQLTDETRKLSLSSVRASISNKEEFNSLIKKARAQEISFGEVRRLNQIAKEEELITKRKIDQLNKLKNATDRQKDEITRLTARQQAFNRTVKITETRLKATNKALRLASVGARGFALALGFVGKFVSGLLGKLTTFITFASIIAAVGSTILDAFGFLEPISKFIEDLLRRGAVLLGITKEAREQAQIREDNPELGGQTTRTRRRGRATITTKGPDLGASAVRVIAEATGKSFNTVIKQIKVAQDGAVKLKAAIDLTGPLNKTRIIFRDTSKLSGEALANANKENEFQVNRVQSLQVAAKLQEALKSGSATLEQIEKRRGAIVAKIANLRKDEDARNKETANLLQKELDILNFNAEAQIAILTARKKLRSEFSAQIKAADNLNKFFTLENELNLDGLRISKSQEDLQRSRIAQLQRSFALGKKALEQQRAGKELTSEISKQLAMLARDAEKALLGSFVKSFEAAKKLDDRLGKILEKENKRLTVAKQQLNVFKAQNAIKDLDIETKALTDQIKRTNDLAKANEKLRVARLQNIEAVRKSEKNLTEELIKMNPFLSESDKRNLVLELEKESLKRLQDSIKEQKEALIANQKAEAEILEKQILQQNKLLNSTGPFGNDSLLKQRADAEKKLQLDKIAADEKAQLKDVKLIEERNELLIQELENFTFHVDGIAQVLANDIVQRKLLSFAAKDERMGKAQGTQLGFTVRSELSKLADTNRDLFEKLMRGAGANDVQIARNDTRFLRIAPIEKLRKILFELERSKVTVQLTKQLEGLKKELAEKDFKTIREAIKGVADANRELAENRGDAKLIAAEAAARKRLNDLQTKLKISGINLETGLANLDTSLISTTNKVSNLADTTKKANDTFSNGIRAIGGVLREQFTAGLTELNDALINGTLNAKNFKEGLTNFLGDTIKQVQQAFFQETIAKPVSDFLTKEVGNLFGVDMSGGIDDVRLEGGAVPVVNKDGKGIVNSFTEKAEASFNTIGEKLTSFKDQAVETFSGLGSSIMDTFKNIGSSISGLFSRGGGGSSVLSMFGSGAGTMFGSDPLMATEAFQGIASGGRVKKFASGGINRDRVPALLEPGEFVMSRKAVNQAGLPAMQQMNAGGTPPISVNIKNEGTPQEATEAQPRFDVDKIVIDVVTRDLRNNGPIRKSLRGGS